MFNEKRIQQLELQIQKLEKKIDLLEGQTMFVAEWRPFSNEIGLNRVVASILDHLNLKTRYIPANPSPSVRLVKIEEEADVRHDRP